MAVILAPEYADIARRMDERIRFLTIPEADRAHIRRTRVGIINLMPQAEGYESSLLYPLGRSSIPVEPVWIRLATHAYRTSDHRHLDRFYVSFEDAIADSPLDGVILTGAPVEHLPFAEVRYWEELVSILQIARTTIASTVGICWGGLALAKMLGIEKTLFPMKVFGLYESRTLDHTHPIIGDFDDVFYCPESRHAGIADEELEAAQARGILRCLAHAEGAGYEIFESADRRFLMHLGHPEYRAERFVTEYTRDMEKGRKDVPAPRNVDLANPLNRWRMHGVEFFGQWVRFLSAATAAVPPADTGRTNEPG